MRGARFAGTVRPLARLAKANAKKVPNAMDAQQSGDRQAAFTGHDGGYHQQVRM